MTHEVITIPPTLLLEVTTKCNYHCPWCYCVWHECPMTTRRDLPTRTWQQIIQAALNCGVQDLMFTGGELTMRRDWRELLAFARKSSEDLSLSIFSNGSRFTDDDLMFCKKQNIRISTSLQGLRTYGEMTGTRRTYRKTIALLARASEIGWPLGVSITVNQTNLSELQDICGAAILAGASSIQVNAMMLEGKARTRTDLALRKQEWDLAKKNLQESYPDYQAMVFSDETLCHCRFQPDCLQEWDLETEKDCPAGKSFGVIDPRGYYRRCLHTVETICHWTQLLRSKGV